MEIEGFAFKMFNFLRAVFLISDEVVGSCTEISEFSDYLALSKAVQFFKDM